MASKAKSKDFEERGGKIYFRRGRSGPLYEVSGEEKDALLKEVAVLRRNMVILVVSFVLVFAATVLLLPVILDLSFQAALMVMFGLMFVSLLPFFLMVRFHLGHQQKVRGILGAREGFNPAALEALETPASETPKPAEPVDARQGVNSGKLVAIFLVGVAITTIGVVMLYYGGDLPFRKQLIWWMNIVTGSMLTGLGFYGLIRKKPRKPTPLKMPRGDQNDLP